MKYIYNTSQMSKLSLTLCTFSVTGSVAGLFLTARCIVANTERGMLVLVDFQNDYHSVDYQIIYLVSIPRVAIWNVTTKQVTLISSNPQMLENGDPQS